MDAYTATGLNGTANVSFYAADKPASYTIIIEGVDMRGHLALGKGKIIIKQDPTAQK